MRIAQSVSVVPAADIIGCGDAAMGAWLTSQLYSLGALVQAHLCRTAAAVAFIVTRVGVYAGMQAETNALLQVCAPRIPEIG